MSSSRIKPEVIIEVRDIIQDARDQANGGRGDIPAALETLARGRRLFSEAGADPKNRNHAQTFALFDRCEEVLKAVQAEKQRAK